MRKLVLLAAFLLVATALLSNAYAVQFLSIEGNINDSSVHTKLSFTMEANSTLQDFPLYMTETVSNFAYGGNAAHKCIASRSGGLTTINCALNLTSENRSFYIEYDTTDYVKVVDQTNFLFDAQFMIGSPQTLFISFKLPEGMALTNDTGTIIPGGYATVSDGRHIIITWKLENDPHPPGTIRFPYERVVEQPLFDLRIVALLIIVVIAAAVVYFWRRSKKERVVYDLLDEYEKKVYEVIRLHDGKVKQNAIVRETGISRAKVSRVVQDLVRRGLVTSVRSGRTNIVEFKKK